MRRQLFSQKSSCDGFVWRYHLTRWLNIHPSFRTTRLPRWPTRRGGASLDNYRKFWETKFDHPDEYLKQLQPKEKI